MPQLTKKQWLKVIKTYKKLGAPKSLEIYQEYRGSKLESKKQIQNLKYYIRKKLKLVDNIGMEALVRKTGIYTKQKPRKKKKRYDESIIPELIDELNEEQKREIIQDWIKEQWDKGKKERVDKYKKFKTINRSHFAKILQFDRSLFYKKAKSRRYKYEEFHNEIIKGFNHNKARYGRQRLAYYLENTYQISINERTLGHYMNRLGLEAIQNKKRRKAEIKATKVHYEDLVKRNFWPRNDNIIACDVSYIPHLNINGNHAYLSIAISHKTKMIESWKLSIWNDQKLVTDTLELLTPRESLIIHSDHGRQYSSNKTQKVLKKLKAKTSMSRIGNSLDNRVAEYFFRTIKSECLKHINTYKMSFEELNNCIKNYIEWYNDERIQKRLLWQSPSQVSQFAV